LNPPLAGQSAGLGLCKKQLSRFRTRHAPRDAPPHAEREEYTTIIPAPVYVQSPGRGFAATGALKTRTTHLLQTTGSQTRMAAGPRFAPAKSGIMRIGIGSIDCRSTSR